MSDAATGPGAGRPRRRRAPLGKQLPRLLRSLGWLGLASTTLANAQPATEASPARASLAAHGPTADAPSPGADGVPMAQGPATPHPSDKADTRDTANTPDTANPSDTHDAARATQRWARSSSQWLARTVDGWFGDKPFAEGGKVSDGRLSLGLFKRQDQRTDVDLRFNAHFRLPNVERYTYLFIGRDDRRNAIRDTPVALRDQQRLLRDRTTERSLLAGLGVLVLDAVDFRLGLGAGLKPFAQARYDRPWALAPGHRVNLRETVFWSNAEGFGSTTALAYDLAATPTLALRWLSAATITQTSRNVGWSTSLAASQSLGGQHTVSLEALAGGSGTGGTGVGASDFGWLARWEQPVYGSWLFAELVGGHFWPKPDALSERGRAWAAGVSLKMRL